MRTKPITTAPVTGNGNGAPKAPGMPEPSFAVPLIVIFAVQLVLVIGAFSGITAMFVTTQQTQIDDNVKTIAVKSLQVSANYVINPLTFHKKSHTIIFNAMKTNPTQLQNQHLNMTDLFSHRYQFGLFRSAILNNPFLAYAYQDYDTGVPCPLQPSVNIITEAVALHGNCDTTDETSTQRYMTVDDSVDNDPSLFDYTVTSTLSNNIVGANSYAQSAMSSTMTQDVWTLPYLWVDTTGTYVLMSYYQCLQPNVTNGRCRNTYGQDLDLTYISTIIGTFGSTPNSVVSLLDLRGMIMMATSAPVSIVDASNNPWPATATPNELTNAAVRRFIAACPSLTNCATMVQSDDTHIYAAIQISPFSGVNMAMVDISERSYYYATADQSRTIAIIVVVVVSTLAAAVCILTFLGVSWPITSLIEAFTLAAEMRNEDVHATSSVLSELQVLSQAFGRMNAKLLAARAYMPQSMLNNDSDDDDDDDEGDPSTSQSQSVSRMSRSKASEGFSIAQSKVSGATSHRSGLSTQRMAGGLVDKKCSVLVLNIVGLHRIVEERRAGSLERDIEKWLDAVQSVVKSEKGVIDAFHGDHLVLTFNSSNTVASHARRAALCGLGIVKAVEKTAFPLVSMGLASGRALTGSVGTASLRAFTTIGCAFTHAVVLERFAKHAALRDQAPTLLSTQHCVEEFSSFVHAYPVGYCAAIKASVHLVAAVVERGADDEWLYEVQHASSKNPFAGVASAVQALMQGETAAAAELIQSCGVTDATQCSDAVKRAWNVARRLQQGGKGELELDGGWCL